MSGTTVFMDDLTYKYDDPINGGFNNRLTSVDDLQGQMMDGDLDDQNDFNYEYDEIGQLKADEAEEIEALEWKVNNKVKSVIRTATSEKPDLYFEYDAMGNRIKKTIIPKLSGGAIDTDNISTTYYILDVQGNQMAKYTLKTEDNLGNPEQNLYFSLRNIYGSSMLGQERIEEIIASSDTNLVDINIENQIVIGDKRYSMSNHLGNVLASVSDRKLLEPDGQGGVEYFLADVVSYSDYYPFGMQMPGRNGSPQAAARLRLVDLGLHKKT